MPNNESTKYHFYSGPDPLGHYQSMWTKAKLWHGVGWTIVLIALMLSIPSVFYLLSLVLSKNWARLQHIAETGSTDTALIMVSVFAGWIGYMAICRKRDTWKKIPPYWRQQIR